MPGLTFGTGALSHELRTLRGAFYRRVAGRHSLAPDVVEAFHQAYFGARDFNLTWRNTYWLGCPVLKCPLDLWLYQEIIHGHRPDLIVESGTAFGGSALFMASMCDLVDHGRIVTIDLVPQPNLPAHNRITYIHGSSTAPETVDRVRDLARAADRVMVILDSDHRASHVADDCRCTIAWSRRAAT